jgi:hypothetical protein
MEAVSSALRTVVSERIDLPPHSSATSRSEISVTVGLPPKEEELANGEPRVNLFLYRATENPALKNQQIPGHGDPAAYGHPPLALNLHYLVTAYGLTTAPGLEDLHDDRTAQQLLGSTMRILHDLPILTADIVDEPDLNGAFERAKLTLEPLSVEDVSKVWTALNRPYRLSAAYEASVVQIESNEAESYAPRVGAPPAGPRPTVVGAVSATIEEIRSALRPGPYARAGEEVVLTGRNLALDDVAATVGGAPATVSSSSDDRLTLIVPDDPSLVAGIVPVRVTALAGLGEPPQPHAIVASNVAALVVVPRVDSAAEAAGVIAIEGSRLYDPGAECLTLIGEAVVRGDAYDAAASSASHVELPRPAGLPAGEHRLRVRVNGAEDLSAATVVLS